MFTVKYFKDKFAKISINDFSKGGVEPGDKPCVLGHCGVDTTKGFYKLSEEAKALNNIFIQYLYPLLNKRGVFFNSLLLDQGIIVYSINDGFISEAGENLLKAIGITHKTCKGRVLQALEKIEKIQAIEMLLQEAQETIDAEFEIID